MQSFGSGLLAGVTSGLIWLAIALMADMSNKSAGLGALICLVGTTLIASVITGALSRGRPTA